MKNRALIRKINSKYELTRTNGDKLLLTAEDARTVYNAVAFEDFRENVAETILQYRDAFYNVTDDIANNDDFINNVRDMFNNDSRLDDIESDSNTILRECMVSVLHDIGLDNIVKEV